MTTFQEVKRNAEDYIVAATIATEVPPTDSPIEEMKAVIDVIRNRVKSGRWGTTALDVVLFPKQFSAVCREAYWRRALTGDWFPRHVEKCLAMWRSSWPDTTDGSLYYYSPISMVPQWSEPSWAANLVNVAVPGVRHDYFRFFKP
jgi:spore germination cell wall hydrolase CwlJ-like protein